MKPKEMKPAPLSVTVKRAAESTGLSTRTIYNLIGSHELESVKVRKRRLVLWSSLESLILSREKV
jgi:excisionase family DNA binding protein